MMRMLFGRHMILECLSKRWKLLGYREGLMDAHRQYGGAIDGLLLRHGVVHRHSHTAGGEGGHAMEGIHLLQGMLVVHRVLGRRGGYMV